MSGQPRTHFAAARRSLDALIELAAPRRSPAVADCGFSPYPRLAAERAAATRALDTIQASVFTDHNHALGIGAPVGVGDLPGRPGL